MWKYQQRAGTTSLVATASGLLFGGDVNGRFRALDQATGKVLWETNLGSAVTGYPITFAIEGKQYVAVSTGSSLATGGIAASDTGAQTVEREQSVCLHIAQLVVSIKSIRDPRSRGGRQAFDGSTCSRCPTGSSVSAAFVQR